MHRWRLRDAWPRPPCRPAREEEEEEEERQQALLQRLLLRLHRERCAHLNTLASLLDLRLDGLARRLEFLELCDLLLGGRLELGDLLLGALDVVLDLRALALHVVELLRDDLDLVLLALDLLGPGRERLLVLLDLEREALDAVCVSGVCDVSEGKEGGTKRERAREDAPRKLSMTLVSAACSTSSSDLRPSLPATSLSYVSPWSRMSDVACCAVCLSCRKK